MELYETLSDDLPRITGLNRVLEYFEISASSHCIVYCVPLPRMGMDASLVTISNYTNGTSSILMSKDLKQATVSVSSCGWVVEPVTCTVPGMDSVINDVLQVAQRVWGQTWEDLKTIIVHEVPLVSGSQEYCNFVVEQAHGKVCLIGLYEDALGPYYAQRGGNCENNGL